MSRLTLSASWRALFAQKSLRRNTIANLVGRIIPAALALLAIPVLVTRLGPEAYGLVGLSLTLEALFAFLDFGLSTAINREIARNVAAGLPPQANRDLLRTFEVLYWPIGIVILGVLIASSGWIASNGLNPSDLSESAIQFSLVVLAFSLAVRWPVSMYSGVLRGLQVQVLQNVVVVAGSAVRVLGGVATVVWISPTIQAFFVSQLIASVVQVTLVVVAAWWELPRSGRAPRFRTSIARSVWRFALGFGLIAILFQLLYQSGLLLVAKLLPLQDVGYYSLAAALAGLSVYVPYAVVDAAFPRFADQMKRQDAAGFRDTYRRAVLVSVLAALTFALPVVFFSADLLLVWTRSQEVAAGARGAATLLAVANLLYATWAVPYTAVIAAGALRLPLVLNLVVVPCAILATAVATSGAGTAGAAAVWACANLLFALVYPVRMSRRIGMPRSGRAAWTAAVLIPWGFAVFGVVALLTRGSPTEVRISGAAIGSIMFLASSLMWIGPRALWGQAPIPDRS